MTGCSNDVIRVVVENSLDIDRHPEIIELSADDLKSKLPISDDESYVIKDSRGTEIPYQITTDGKYIFQVQMSALDKKTYTIGKGTPSEFESLVFAKHYPDKDGDFAWENDKVGFRMYGHDLDVASGYDLFCKRGTHLPILEQLYSNEVYGSNAWKRYRELEKISQEAAFRFKMDTLSFHVDRGYGMDVYAVGPTLGAGIAALMENEEISYPYCFKTYEILEKGPLRLQVKFTFRPITVGENKEVVETRTITIDAGSHLNYTKVSYDNLSETKEIVAGIIMREEGGEPHTDMDCGYISYPAPTQNHDTTKVVDNGTIYVGHVYPKPMDKAKIMQGHILATTTYNPGDVFSYYWGFGWNHSDILSHQQWDEYLETFAAQLKTPLTIKLK